MADDLTKLNPAYQQFPPYVGLPPTYGCGWPSARQYPAGFDWTSAYTAQLYSIAGAISTTSRFNEIRAAGPQAFTLALGSVDKARITVRNVTNPDPGVTLTLTLCTIGVPVQGPAPQGTVQTITLKYGVTYEFVMDLANQTWRPGVSGVPG